MQYRKTSVGLLRMKTDEENIKGINRAYSEAEPKNPARRHYQHPGLAPRVVLPALTGFHVRVQGQTN
jgi:hypothetical protein